MEAGRFSARQVQIPSTHGYKTALWTLPRVASLIEDLTGFTSSILLEMSELEIRRWVILTVQIFNTVKHIENRRFY